MKNIVIKKKDFPDFIKFLKSSRTVVAPVSKGYNNYSFEKIESADEISLEYIPTILPPKKYLMPQYEVLAEYNRAKGQQVTPVVELEDLVLFGVHTCDIAGIQCLNVVFNDRPRDLNYLMRKSKIIIIGIECNDYCDDFASCAMMENHIPFGGYDLLLTIFEDYFLIHVNTQIGENIIMEFGKYKDAGTEHLLAYSELQDIKKKNFKPEVDVDIKKIPGMFKKSYDSNIWDELGKRCLACGNCTNVCPTCYCYDVLDIPDLDLNTGKRVRQWDSCQNEGFAKVAGGESFRNERKDRQRHRFNRKFSYPVERYGRFFCTGCGRCSRTCMAKINMKEKISNIAEEFKNE